MGMIRVTASGSFAASDKTFSAMESGHAVAVDDAIKHLLELKEWAVRRDMQLRTKGDQPRDRFAEAYARELLLHLDDS